MDYIELYEKMKECRLISGTWKHLLRLLSDEIGETDNADAAMKLFVLYFSLVDDGNTYMSLDEKAIKDIFNDKIEKQRITVSEEEGNESGKSKSQEEAETALEAISAEIEMLANKASILNNNLPVIGENKLFIINDNRLFARKYYNAVESIKESVERLLTTPAGSDAATFDLDEVPQLTNGRGERVSLKEAQKRVVRDGITKNLLVTGGPGTGKTTSVFFLLLGLLCNDENYEIYLTAPSGKAAARMSESINEEKGHVCEPFKTEKESIIDKIASAEGWTIHRLLGISRETNGFLYNKDHQFPENSIFVIDEASMIDVCLFASLLEAIPDGARVFILGDKNQLPSVECGAVYGELLKKYNDHVIELTETNRFSSDSEIYKLSERINRGEDLEIGDSAFRSISEFKIENEEQNNEILYYADNQNSNREIIEQVTKTWYGHYYTGFQKKCTDIINDTATFDSIYKDSEQTKILCALRETTRGAEHINKFVLDNYYQGKRISGFYPGELLMITKNLKSLDLYNGDCGVTVKFAQDENLYFMIKKSDTADLQPAEVKTDNRIFRLGEYFFYPVRMIGREDIFSAFAITVHKAQGSGYDDVFVILPKTKGHPLLNRQLVYTAITRTKKHTYIISNNENLEYSSKNVLSRNTGISQ